ncbi:20131_t:CDS:2 [Entrophospora sp. SA101]|nr:20131_t:CDS:2 [Entrophospora sp. SA101]
MSLKSSNKSSNPTLTGTILSDNEDNDIQLLDDNGNVSNNNEYELTTFSSPISPPLPVFSNDNEENIISSYYENRLSDGEGNKDTNSIIVNKDNNKDTYVRVNSTDNNSNDGGDNNRINEGKNTNTSQNRTEVLQKKTYDTTKSAAKRMALFCLFFIIINFLGSITTLKVALTGEDFNPHIQPNDVIGSMIGIIVTSVFCTSSEIKRLKSIFTRR